MSYPTTLSAYQPLLAKIDELLRTEPRVLLAIDGDAAAGKSTLAELLRQAYDCNVFAMDHFFLRPEQRTQARLDEPGGNVDYVRFQAEILTPLGTGQPFTYRPWDCKTGDFGTEIPVTPNPLNIIEGAYSQHPMFGDVHHIKVFLTVPPEEQLRRIGLRNGETQLERFQTEWIPMEKRYFAAFGIQAQCEFVFGQ